MNIESMTTEQKTLVFRGIWLQVMPAEVEPCDEITLDGWIENTRPGDLEYAIRQAGKKMRMNVIKVGIPEPHAAEQFTGSIIRFRNGWRKRKEYGLSVEGIKAFGQQRTI